MNSFNDTLTKRYDFGIKNLKLFKILKKDKNLEQFLISKNLEQLLSIFDKHETKLKTHYSNFGICTKYFMYSEMFYFEMMNTENTEVKFKATELYEFFDEKIIDILAPWFLSFFKWDIERRFWDNKITDYKIKYLKEISNSISDELSGNAENFPLNYIKLLFDYIENYIKKILRNPVLVEKLMQGEEFKEHSLYDMLSMLTEFKKAEISTYSDIFEPFINIFRPLADNYLSGLINTEERYNKLFLGFIKAQCLYRDYLNTYIQAIENRNDSDKVAFWINENKFEEFIGYLKSLLATVPNVLGKNTNEAYYHIYTHLVLKLSGVDIESEVQTNIGRIDFVIKTSTHITIVELKMEDNNDAIQQIMDKKYYERYLSDSRKLNLLGITFSKKERNIVNYKILENYF